MSDQPGQYDPNKPGPMVAPPGQLQPQQPAQPAQPATQPAAPPGFYPQQAAPSPLPGGAVSTPQSQPAVPGPAPLTPQAPQQPQYAAPTPQQLTPTPGQIYGQLGQPVGQGVAPQQPIQEVDDTLDLSMFDQAYEQAQEVTRPPDGVYNARITSIALDTSSNGNDMLVWELTVMEGPHTNARARKRNMLTSKKNLSFLKSDFKKIGFNPPQGLMLPWIQNQQQPPALASLVGIRLKIRLTTKQGQEYPECYFQSYIGPAIRETVA